MATPATVPSFLTGVFDESIDPLFSVDELDELESVSNPVNGILLSIKEANVDSVLSGFLYNFDSLSSISNCNASTELVGK